VNIYFHASGPKSGLDNNGGSRTILKSAEVLRELGHHVDVVASYDAFTWFSHPKPIKQVPEGDGVVVAVSARDVKNAVKYARGKPVYWWIRGKELWQMPEEKLIQRAKWVNCIVNAEHLRDWLKSHGVKSKLCYAGIDDLWEPEGDDLWDMAGFKASENIQDPIVVGCLKNMHHPTKRWDMCLDLLGRLDEKRFKVIHTGAPDKTEEQMREIYQKCDIWFAPSELEGFHNVPLEAGLCGCLVVCRRSPRGGCRDYATEETAHLFDTIEEAVEAILRPDFRKIPRFFQYAWPKIGSRHSNMEKFVGILCRK